MMKRRIVKRKTVVTLKGKSLLFGAGRIAEATLLMSGEEETKVMGNMLAHFGKFRPKPGDEGLRFEIDFDYIEIKEYLKKVRSVIFDQETKRLVNQFQDLIA